LRTHKVSLITVLTLPGVFPFDSLSDCQLFANARTTKVNGLRYDALSNPDSCLTPGVAWLIDKVCCVLIALDTTLVGGCPLHLPDKHIPAFQSVEVLVLCPCFRAPIYNRSVSSTLLSARVDAFMKISIAHF